MNHFQQYLAEEYAEDYWQGRIDRRVALKVISAVTGTLLAEPFLAACAPAARQESPTSAVYASPSPQTTGGTPSPAGTVASDDPDILAGPMEVPAGDTLLQSYLARPAGDERFPVVLVCHENRGLTDHIRDVVRRLAKAGYAAVAVDLLSRHGGTETVGTDNVPAVLATIPPDQFVSDFADALDFLRGQTYADTEAVGMVGFCFGGGVTWSVATHLPELKAAVPFYGPHPPVEDVPGIQAAVLAIYAGRDERINQGIPPIEAAMQANGKVYEKVIYPGVDHAFHNDTTARYDPAAAQDAWRRTLDWFDRYLRGSG